MCTVFKFVRQVFFNVINLSFVLDTGANQLILFLSLILRISSVNIYVMCVIYVAYIVTIVLDFYTDIKESKRHLFSRILIAVERSDT